MRNTTLCYIEKDESYLMLHRIKKVNDENKDKWIYQQWMLHAFQQNQD